MADVSAVASLAQFIAAAVFVVAGLGKIHSPHRSARAAHALAPRLIHRLSFMRPSMMARALGMVEVVLGFALALDVWRPAPALLAAGMLSGFTALLINAARRGVQVPCGCLGSRSRIGALAIGRNVLLLALVAARVIHDAASVTFGTRPLLKSHCRRR